jgi:hypothetical protein
VSGEPTHPDLVFLASEVGTGALESAEWAPNSFLFRFFLCTPLRFKATQRPFEPQAMDVASAPTKPVGHKWVGSAPLQRAGSL